MKTTYNWIKDFVDISLTPEELAEKLTMAGIEVKNIEPCGGDHIFEIEITSNRPDWLSVAGLAREVAAVTGQKVKGVVSPAGVKLVIRAPAKESGAYPLTIDIEDRDDCPLYTAKVVTGVSVGPSPDWLRNRLEMIGCRSVNNIVDITNYVLYEFGEPLHAFDLDKLSTNMIRIRRAADKETIVTIDGQSRELNKDVLVIADAKRPVAVAGVMGGKDTEVSDSTKNILLEAAIFNPVLVRRGRQKLCMSSDASYRFERGVDYDTAVASSDRAVALIQALAGGQIAAQKSAGISRPPAKKTAITVSEVERALGVQVSAAKIKSILESLGFEATAGQNQSIQATAPLFRQDVKAPVDLIEEIARVNGFDKIPSSLAKVTLQPKFDDLHKRIREVKAILTGLGLSEVITYSMMDKSGLADFWPDTQQLLSVANPISQGQECLRPVLVPSLISCVSYNVRQQQLPVNIFEMAKVYRHDGAGRYDEPYHIGIALCGERKWLREEPHSQICDPAGMLHLKGIVETLAQRLGIPGAECVFTADPAGLVAVSLCGDPAGTLMRASKEILARADIKHKEVFAAELDLSVFLKHRVAVRSYTAFSRFPGIIRDISVVLPASAQASNVRACIVEHAGELLQRVEITDFYTGKPIPAGFKNLTISCYYCSDTRTLQEAEVNAAHSAVTDALVKTFKASLR